MQRIDARRLDRRLDVHVEHDHVQQHVQDLLILAVAARRADREKRLAVLQHDRRRQRRARPLAAGEHVRADRIEIEHLHPVRQRHAGVAGDERAAEQPAGARRRAEQIAVLVDDVDAGRVAGRVRRLRRPANAGVARAPAASRLDRTRTDRRGAARGTPSDRSARGARRRTASTAGPSIGTVANAGSPR